MDDATEFPTADRLQELREQGKAAHSARSSACMVVAIFSVAALAAPSPLDEFSRLLDLPEPGYLGTLHGALNAALLKWVLVPAVLAVAVTVVWGLVQTKFLFRLNLVSLDFGRLLPRHGFGPGRAGRALGVAIVSFVIATISAWILLSIVGVELFKIFHDASPAGARGIFQAVNAFLPILIMVGTLSGLVFFLFGRLIFALDNRMSRKEILAEQR